MGQALRVENLEIPKVTLLELVQAVADVTEDEREIVATVTYMLRQNHVKLCGNFHDEPFELF